MMYCLLMESDIPLVGVLQLCSGWFVMHHGAMHLSCIFPLSNPCSCQVNTYRTTIAIDLTTIKEIKIGLKLLQTTPSK